MFQNYDTGVSGAGFDTKQKINAISGLLHVSIHADRDQQRLELYRADDRPFGH